MKKISAILLALIMMLSMVASAGSITIENTTAGVTYNVYKVFDATYIGTGADAKVSYFYNGDNADLIAALNAETSPFTFEAATKNVVRKENVEDADIIAWVKANAANLGAVVTTITGNGVAVTASDLGFGYYYIASTADGANAVTIDSVIPDVTVVDKNEDGPTPPSKVIVDGSQAGATGNSADIGDVINYKVTGTIARYDDNDPIEQYTFTDTMSTGLYLNASSIVVKVNGVTKTAGTDYTVNTSDHGFTVVLDNMNDDGTFIYPVDAAYEITYSATLTEDAVIDGDNGNSMKLEWNNEDETDTTTTKTYKIDVFKYTNGENNAKNGLAGAGFVLKNADGKYYKYVPATEDNAETDVNEYVPANVEWVVDIADATEYVTAAEAYTVTFTGLKNGTYTLVEKTVPAGYNKAADKNVTIDDASLTGSTQVEVLNSTGSELPSTGGIGTTIFYTVGGLMMAAAIVLLVAKKKVAASK